jgi:type IV pilus assembly protein PilY1
MDFPIDLKVKLLNYLGYDLPLSTTTVLPSLLPVPSKPFITLGGSIHSFPVQLTYSGELDANGDLTTVRKQSVLFGSMEGGLHVLDAKQGVEQMVFVPSDILKDPSASKSLRGVDQAGDLTHGVSGAWVADPAYKFSKGSGSATSSVDARQMNVYGGMRMGGSSFYGLDLLNPTSPKLLFRVGPDLGGKYSRMGQSWSKPVLANVRYNGVITRVVIVGGGYDMCYENPRFKLGQSNPAEYGGGCNKSQAMGNAVYMLDANTGSVLWWASNSGADNNNPNMTHSIVSRISTLDRDADGLVDHLYFGDLGGQVFRADFNNKSTATKFGVRVVRMANLGSTTVSSGDQPRFYQPPTLTIHDVGVNTFIVVGIASGDRSTPLDVSPSIGREAMLPSTALSGRPTNKVYGLIDRDFINKNLMSIADGDLKTKDIVLSNLVENPQTLSMSNLTDKLSPSSGSATNQGWYRSLSSDYAGNKVAGRTDGGVKAFEEEPIAIKNNLFIPVYDPEGTGLDPVDPCSTRIIGESNRQQYCLPFGKCETTALEEKTGFRISGGKNQNVIGSGIRGITLGPGNPGGTGGPGGPSGSGTKNSCGNLTLVGNITGSGEWQCSRLLNPIRWYERYVTAKTK